jgi:DNA/RNA endonuclease G (NUC1)
MQICFDQGLERTHYVHHELTPANAAHQSGVRRISFYGGPFFTDPRMNSVYSQYKQREKLRDILGSTQLAESLIRGKSSFFLARGHLAPKADFIMGLHQRATFQFINAAPQWQVFNSKNWERVETGVRDLAGARKLKLDIITGTYDTLALPDINGTPQEIYLSHDINNNPTVPVPKFYYKIVLNRQFNSGLAIVGVNNPYATKVQIETDYLLCDDVSEHVTWIQWDRENLKNGYSYACDVNQLLQVIKHLPPLSVQNLLL